MNEPTRPAELAVLCRIGARLCALPIEHVAETMRPLPVMPLADMPPFILGISIVRSAPIPVIHAGKLLGADDAAVPARFVTMNVGERSVALAVDTVVGIRDLAALALGDLPPLLQDAGAVVAALGTLDANVLLVLQSARVVAESLWPALDAGPAR